jgi:hypothetical protein
MDEKFNKTSEQVVDHNIHNTIDSAALWFVDIIKKKVADKDEAGMTFTCMAAGTMLAFSFEAYLNVIGEKKLPLWNEWDDYHTKIERVFQHLKISPDWGKRPYSSVSVMKRLRNTLAHGKPEKTEKKRQFVDKADGQKGKDLDMTADWQKLCTPDMIINANDDLSDVWKDMYQKSGIEIMTLMPQGQLTVTIGKKFVPDDKPKSKLKFFQKPGDL